LIVDLATFTRESALNRQAYGQFRERIESEFAGQYVALAHGQLVGAAPTFDEARALVRQLKPVPEYYLVFPAAIEPDFGLIYDLTESAEQCHRSVGARLVAASIGST
jgi:hypothetical protein